MKTINNNTVKQLIDSLEAMSSERYNNARETGTENVLYRGIGEQSAVLDVLAEKLGALWMFGADFAYDREAIEDWCSLVINRANKLAAQAGDDFADGSTTAIMTVSFGKVCRWIYDTTNASKQETATEETTEQATNEETTEEEDKEQKQRRQAREAFATTSQESKTCRTPLQVANYITKVGKEVRNAVGAGNADSDAEIDAKYIYQQLSDAKRYGYNPGKYSVYYRSFGTHTAHNQREADNIRENWGSQIVGRLKIERTENGYTVTRQISE